MQYLPVLDAEGVRLRYHFRSEKIGLATSMVIEIAVSGGELYEPGPTQQCSSKQVPQSFVAVTLKVHSRFNHSRKRRKDIPT